MTILVNDSPETLDLERALEEVSSERRSYALGYRHERDRRLSVAVYLLLKEAVMKEYGVTGDLRIVRGLNGKPCLRDHPEIHFNLSHCARAAACVVANEPVGIDVEEIAPIDWDVAQSVLSDAELTDVRSSREPEVAFACYWTKKEALVKLTGRGIDETHLQTILADASDFEIETTLNRAKGYALTTATKLSGRFS